MGDGTGSLEILEGLAGEWRRKMFANHTEAEAREKILSLVKEYCGIHHKEKPYQKGDRIPYASRVYDSAEMCGLVDAALDFWLTSGRYTRQFEERFAA